MCEIAVAAAAAAGDCVLNVCEVGDGLRQITSRHILQPALLSEAACSCELSRLYLNRSFLHPHIWKYICACVRVTVFYYSDDIAARN